jgi:hypothetical protein
MLRRGLLLVLVLGSVGASAQVASADPVNAKNVGIFTAFCGSQQVQVAVNGNGVFAPGHVIGSTRVFIPTAFNLTFAFTPTGGATETETETSAKKNQPARVVTCALPAALNTVTVPGGTFVLSGTVTGFFTGK